MAKIKFNSNQFQSLEEYLNRAQNIVSSLVDIWKDKFNTLYDKYISSGYINSLYLAKESQIETLIFNKNIAKDRFIELLTACHTNDYPCYKELISLQDKINNIVKSINKFQEKLNEFNKEFMNLENTANRMGLKTKVAIDGTLLSVDTSVSINDSEVNMSTSEALNSFYTYSNTVMKEEIATDYLTRTYGYEMDYTELVSNTNSFMTDTISSDLYSHEFINAILPEYTPIMHNAESGATIVDLNNIQSNVNSNVLGNVLLFGGFLGSAIVGSKQTLNAIKDINLEQNTKPKNDNKSDNTVNNQSISSSNSEPINLSTTNIYES